jgi:hypothetical protein
MSGLIQNIVERFRHHDPRIYNERIHESVKILQERNTNMYYFGFIARKTYICNILQLQCPCCKCAGNWKTLAVIEMVETKCD